MSTKALSAPGKAQDATRHAQEEIGEAEAEAESAAQVKVTVMLEEVKKRIAASKTGAEGTLGDPLSSWNGRLRKKLWRMFRS